MYERSYECMYVCMYVCMCIRLLCLCHVMSSSRFTSSSHPSRLYILFMACENIMTNIQTNNLDRERLARGGAGRLRWTRERVFRD